MFVIWLSLVFGLPITGFHYWGEWGCLIGLLIAGSLWLWYETLPFNMQVRYNPWEILKKIFSKEKEEYIDFCQEEKEDKNIYRFAEFASANPKATIAYLSRDKMAQKEDILYDFYLKQGESNEL